MTEQQLDCALDLMRRLPPQQIEKNLSDLIDLVPSLCEDLLSSVDQPLKIARDKVVGKDYLLCDYNRDGDSYRSVLGPIRRAGMYGPHPWFCSLAMENKIRSTLNEIYFGKPKDIVNGLRSVQSFADKSKQEALKNDLVEALKRKQQKASTNLFPNTTFWQLHVMQPVVEGRAIHRELYYPLLLATTCVPVCITFAPPPRRYFEGGVSSVYLWDLDHGFAGVILIKKAGDGSKKIKGCWDSIHVVEVQEKSSGRTAHYKLTSTVMLWLQTNKTGSGTMNLGGSLTRQMEKDETVSDSSPHIANIGRLVEVSTRAPPAAGHGSW
eukprot:XP_017945468.1 PREDICTED: F-actin-capping protein subunit beta [Xenopus tropicalis]